ncbi:MAG: transcription antitermination factor NusB [Candidatus Izemoplasmatales bacterium]|jgi:N utilization substance protein B|nr:transcription antitermination factor NusB [Candidatus Izemoplasmatales bacterium]MDD4595774.1 transcription antitermination factor NusB [Candidatus Izemoplasmatales bacterium]
MSQRKERESVTIILYLKSMQGQFTQADYPEIVLSRVAQIWDHLDVIDQIISQNLENWTIDRLNLVDKAIIRNAVYELKYTDLPYEIVIDEAIELTKKYTNLDDDKARAFNNKLLDTIKNHLTK